MFVKFECCPTIVSVMVRLFKSSFENKRIYVRETQTQDAKSSCKCTRVCVRTHVLKGPGCQQWSDGEITHKPVLCVPSHLTQCRSWPALKLLEADIFSLCRSLFLQKLRWAAHFQSLTACIISSGSDPSSKWLLKVQSASSSSLPPHWSHGPGATGINCAL